MLYFGSHKQKGRGPFQHPVKTALWCLDRYFPPNQTCISCYFDVDSSLFTGLASVFVCFPQFLFCYSLHSFVQPLDLEEEAKKIRAAPFSPSYSASIPRQVRSFPVEFCLKLLASRWCKSPTRMTIIPEDSKLAQTRTIKELSQILRIKKNLVALRKRIRRKTSTAEVKYKQYFANFNHNLVCCSGWAKATPLFCFETAFVHPQQPPAAPDEDQRALWEIFKEEGEGEKGQRGRMDDTRRNGGHESGAGSWDWIQPGSQDCFRHSKHSWFFLPVSENPSPGKIFSDQQWTSDECKRSPSSCNVWHEHHQQCSSLSNWIAMSPKNK